MAATGTTIWKFPLQTMDSQPVMMPQRAKILTVQAQHDEPCLWAIVNPNAPREVRMIDIVGTGHPMFEDLGLERKYIGTFQLRDGDLVFHVFERLS